MAPAATLDDPASSTVVLICADAEWNVTLEHFASAVPAASPFGDWLVTTIEGDPLRRRVAFFHTGWGKVAAAAATQYVIDRWAPALLLNLGTCGGFQGAIETGEVLVAERTVIYDIFEQMGDASTALAHYAITIDLSWLDERQPAGARRVTLVSADRDLRAEDIARLGSEHGAVAGDWESGAIAYVATRNATRLLILRVVTDLVGPQGGEVYGAYPLFVDRARQGMSRLFHDLPAWLTRAAGTTAT